MNAEAETLDIGSVPELVEVIRAHQRSREVERLRGNAARDLAVAVYDASLVASIALIAEVVGISRQRAMRLEAKGRQIVAQEKKGAKK